MAAIAPASTSPLPAVASAGPPVVLISIWAVQVGETMVSARIVNYTAAAARPLEEMKPVIQARLKQEEAAKAALKDADALAAKLDSEKPQAGSDLIC